MADTGRIFIEPIIIITEPKLAKVIASVAIILRASLELATIRAGDFGAGGDTRSSGRVVYRTAGCGVEGGRAGSYPQHRCNSHPDIIIPAGLKYITIILGQASPKIILKKKMVLSTMVLENLPHHFHWIFCRGFM